MITAMSAMRSLLDPLQQFDAVQPRHLQVADHHVELRRLELRPGLLAVGRGDHFMPLRRQIVGQRDAFDFLVVNDQNSHGSGSGKEISESILL